MKVMSIKQDGEKAFSHYNKRRIEEREETNTYIYIERETGLIMVTQLKRRYATG